MTELIEALNPPVADRGTGSVRTGTPVSRVDGRAKVTGQAKYAAELPAPDLAYGVVVSSPAAKGRIVAIDTQAALAVPGVVEVLTHLNRPKIRSFDIAYKDMTAPAGSPFRPLYDDRVMYSGQPLALVVAETFEAARYAASLVRFEIDTEPHGTKLSANLERAYKPKPLKAGYEPPPDEKGNTDAAYAQAPVKIDAEFYSGVEHHNPMELFASTVIRDPSGHLTIYDKTQSSQNSRWYVSHVFGLSKNKVTVRNPYVGGAFGSGLRPQYQLTLAVMAALHLKRSVRVVLTRQQMFSFGHRPETVQRVKLAADNDGTLRAIWHQAIAETSPIEDYVEVVVNWSGMLYQCDNIKLDYKLVKLDHYTPIDMRAPGAAHGVHALEVAMDELAWELKMDPLALRLKNYAERSPVEDKPYSSKELRACYELAAKKFGWDQRPLNPRSMREGTELIGWGMATGVWDAMQMFARASAVLHADGKLVVSSAATDIGTGTYTVMAMIAAEALGLPLEDVTFQLGDSTLPVAPIEGGLVARDDRGLGRGRRLREAAEDAVQARQGAVALTVREHPLQGRGIHRRRAAAETRPAGGAAAGRHHERQRRGAPRREVPDAAEHAQAAQVPAPGTLGGLRRGARGRADGRGARDAGNERRGGGPHHEPEDGDEPGGGRHRVGHQPGAA